MTARFRYLARQSLEQNRVGWPGFLERLCGGISSQQVGSSQMPGTRGPKGSPGSRMGYPDFAVLPLYRIRVCRVGQPLFHGQTPSRGPVTTLSRRRHQRSDRPAARPTADRTTAVWCARDPISPELRGGGRRLSFFPHDEGADRFGISEAREIAAAPRRQVPPIFRC